MEARYLLLLDFEKKHCVFPPKNGFLPLPSLNVKYSCPLSSLKRSLKVPIIKQFLYSFKVG